VRRVLLDRGYVRDPALTAAARELRAPDGGEAERLALYRRIRAAPVAAADLRPEVAEALVLCGIAAERHAHLEPRNRVFAEVFDLAWVASVERRRPLTLAITAWRQGGGPSVRKGCWPRTTRSWSSPSAMTTISGSRTTQARS
jgi:hypothetical protein